VELRRGHVAVGRLQLVVEGGRGKVQRLSADALVAGGDEVHRSVDTGLQVGQREEGLQELQNQEKRDRNV